MATNLLTFHHSGIYASAVPGHAKQAPNRRKNSATPSSSANLWGPLFGWSTEPDYFDSDGKTEVKERGELESETETAQKQARWKFPPGSFTAEKARQLRMMTTNTKSFHDAMYHSTIASRLASDFKDRSDL